MIPSRLPPSSGVGQPTIGRPFYGQAKGLLSPAGRQPFERSEVGLFSDGRKPGCMVFAAKGGIKKWRPKGRRTSPAQRYFITTLGGSPQPVREASAGPWRNPWRPGPEARRRHEPSAPQGLSTFGNTAEHRIPHKGPSSQMIRTAKKH